MAPAAAGVENMWLMGWRAGSGVCKSKLNTSSVQHQLLAKIVGCRRCLCGCQEMLKAGKDVVPSQATTGIRATYKASTVPSAH